MLQRLIAAAALAVLPLAAHAAPASPWQGKLHACILPEGHVKAFCGSYEVFENREARSGRKIALKIVLLPAKGRDRAPDPVFFLEGGPGAGATADAAGLAGDPARARRDLVLVDVRGTGGSNPLSCPLWGDGTRLDHIFPLDAVTACRDALEKRADLTQYTTTAAMDDVDEVRRYLGYGPVNLYGSSYGTFAAQIFLARHPEAVRTVVLASVVKPGEPAPLYHARNAQQGLELLARDCTAEPACHAAFPQFPAEVTTVLDRLAKQPVKVKVKDPRSGKPVTVELTRSAAADALRFALYSPDKASQVPLRVHLAAQGDYRVLAQTAVLLRANLQKGLAWGDLFSVSCAEDLTFIDPREIPAATRGTFYGDDRVREQLAVCGVWPHAKRPADWGKLIHSDVPVLLLSGERDPVTPPADAALVAKGFPHGLLVLIPHGSHANEGSCEGRLVADFLERGTVQGLDVSCLKAGKTVPFVTDAAKIPKQGS
ncbi:MAG TPA: alpha/beta fold hydrolase [Thermoanaerobaculia bacterium]|nr:alpha/beta fold hydrolase [Thermoanaerobaculia bacterium]